MKDTTTKRALDRIRAIVASHTGNQLGADTAVAVENVLREFKGDERAATRGEFLNREVTIVLAALRGLAAVAAAHPAGVVIQLLNPCLIEMSEIIFRHGGTIDKFMGDSIMALFGAPVSREDDAQRAVACAVEMQMAMKTINLAHHTQKMPELYMGIGINTGTVLAGTLGSERYSEYTVIGDEVNLASRIQAFSLRGQVLISQNTYERCRDFVETGETMHVHVKGKPQPVGMREVTAIPSLGLKVPRQEIRRSHRIKVKLPARFSNVLAKMVRAEPCAGTIRDIGYHGVLLEPEHELPLHSEIKLEFHLPLVDYQARDVCAKVVRLQFVEGRQHVGIEFTSVPPETNVKIQLFVQLLILTNLGWSAISVRWGLISADCFADLSTLLRGGMLRPQFSALPWSSETLAVLINRGHPLVPTRRPIEWTADDNFVAPI